MDKTIRLHTAKKLCFTIFIISALIFLTFGCPLEKNDPPQTGEPQLDVVSGASEYPVSNNKSPLTLGPVSEGSAALVTSIEIRNSGNEDLVIESMAFTDTTYYAIETPLVFPLTISPAGAQAVDFSFNPASEGIWNSSVEIISNDTDNSPFLLNYSATVTEAVITNLPNMVVALSGAASGLENDGSPVSLGSLVAGSGSVTSTLEIRNTGTAALSVTQLELTGDSAYQISSTHTLPESVDPSGNLEVQLSFNPASVGVYAAQLVISGNDTNVPEFKVNYTATVTATPEPNIAVLLAASGASIENAGDAVDMGTLIEGGASGSIAIRIHNNGNAGLQISNMTFSGNSYYSLASTPSFPLDIAAGTYINADVTVNPLNAGVLDGTLTISSNDSDEGTFEANFTADVEVPTPELVVNVDGSVVTNDAPAFVFSPINPGESDTVLIELENDGTGVLQIDSISLNDEINFSLASLPTLTASINPGDSISFQAVFSSSTSDDYEAVIEITGNESSPFIINLSGTVTDNTAPIPPSGLNASALSSKAVQLNWNDNSGDEDHFIVQYSEDPGFGNYEEIEIAADKEAVKILDITSDTTWYFQVCAVNGDGISSDWSSESATLSSAGEITVEVTWEKGTFASGTGSYVYSIWLENPAEDFYQNIFVCHNAFARTNITGNNFSGETDDDIALDHWNRIVRQNFDDSEIDAVSAATEKNKAVPIYSSVLFSGHETFSVYIEVDHSWDGNGWFGTGEQPPVIFKADVDLSQPDNEYDLEFVGWTQLKHVDQEVPFPTETQAGTWFIGQVTDADGVSYTHTQIKNFILTNSDGTPNTGSADRMISNPKIIITR